jgi:hypothetical protein
MLTASNSVTNLQFLWSTGEQTPSISISNGGTYSVTVTNPDGCSYTDSIQITNDPCASIAEELDYHLNIRPNPTQEIAYIEISGLTVFQIRLYNAEGQLLKELHKHENDILIDLSSYYKGVYFIESRCKEGTFVRKIVKN